MTAIMRWLRIDWSGPLTSGWSAWYDHAGSFFVIDSGGSES